MKPQCDTGRPRYDSKEQARKAHPGVKIMKQRCDRCRGWHPDIASKRNRRKW